MVTRHATHQSTFLGPDGKTLGSGAPLGVCGILQLCDYAVPEWQERNASKVSGDSWGSSYGHGVN